MSDLKLDLIPFSHGNRDIELAFAQSCSEVIYHEQVSFCASSCAACPRHFTRFPQTLIAFEFCNIVSTQTDVEACFHTFLSVNDDLFQKVAACVIIGNIDFSVTFA